MIINDLAQQLRPSHRLAARNRLDLFAVSRLALAGARTGGRGGSHVHRGGGSSLSGLFRAELFAKGFLLQGRSAVDRLTHNQEAAGSIPAPAPNAGGAA